MNTSNNTRPGSAEPYAYHGSALVYTIYRHGVRLPEPEAADRARLAAKPLAAGQAT